MFGMPGPFEMIIVGIVALLLFGKRLPEVARSLGKGIVEFKKGVRGIEDDLDRNTYSSSNSNYNTDSSANRPAPQDAPVETTAPKFEPPKSAPV